MTDLRLQDNSTRAHVLALECVTAGMWEAPPHASEEQFETAVWRLATLGETVHGPLPDAVKQVRDREIWRLLRELRTLE